MSYIEDSKTIQTANGQNIGSMNSLEQGIENWWTGSLDYARQLESMEFQNAFNSAEALKNRQWQERMSNTAYQRATEDMKKAGLNPYLLATGASPASSPAGASASAGTGVSRGSGGKGFGNVLSALGALVTTAISAGTSSAISAGKISSTAMNEALRATTAKEVAEMNSRRNQFREIHHYNHKS